MTETTDGGVSPSLKMQACKHCPHFNGHQRFRPDWEPCAKGHTPTFGKPRNQIFYGWYRKCEDFEMRVLVLIAVTK